MKSARRLDRELAALAAALVAPLIQLLAPACAGLAPFWGDLTYLHHPWRAFDAQVLQAGRLPVWDPYIYFGMPAAASMQDSLYYPGTVPFFFFGFAGGMLAYHLAHYALSAAFAFLWLRSCGLRRGAACAGAALLALGGVWLENRPFLNHLAVLSLMPALFLLARRPGPLALVLCAAFLAGYPQILVGAAAAAFAWAWILSRGRERGELARGWTTAAAWSAGLSAVLLIPAVELVGLSHRSAGVGLSEALQFGFSPSDLLQWISPWAVRSFDPAVEWWKSCFIGFSGAALAAAGLFFLPRARAGALALWLAAVVLLTLGGSNPVSAFLWAHLPPLRFVRYPGNFSYLAVPALALCAAAAVQRARSGLAWGLVLVLSAELFAGGVSAFPLARAGLFASAGPLVRRLQGAPAQSRYLLSPRALEAGQGSDYDDWKHRLYGITNAPYRLRAAGNFGEPLTPQADYEVMDRLYSAKSAAQAAALFPWTGVAYLLSPQAPPPSASLVDEGTVLWNISRVEPAPSPAYLLTEKDGTALPENLPEVPPARRGSGLEIAREREDRFSIEGESGEPGWVYMAEPRFPGWNAVLRTERGEGRVPISPALGAFQKIHVPQGRWTLELRYEPASLRWGLLLTLLFGLGLAARCLRAARGWAA